MIASDLKPEQFVEWRKKNGMSTGACAKKLGVSVSSIFLYENGERKEGEVKIPLTIAWAMSAIQEKLEPYKGENNDIDQIK